MTEDQRIKAIQTAVGGINKYSDALKELAKSEKEELKQQLETLKKENFQNLSKVCMEEYTEKYGEPPKDEYWVYMVADYGATGEGETRCLMCTQAVPSKDEDFGDEPYDYTPKTTQEYRAVRKFHETFGTWMLYGLRFLSKEAFFSECAYYLPPVMMKLANAKCSKEFYTEVHFNFS